MSKKSSTKGQKKRKSRQTSSQVVGATTKNKNSRTTTNFLGSGVASMSITGSDTHTQPVSVALLCGLTDPFCEHANGVKYPDAAAGRSMPYTYRTRYQTTTDAAGAAASLFAPGYTYQNATAIVTGGSAAFSLWTTIGGPLISPSQFRIVSYGIRIRSIAAPTTASGIVMIRGFAGKFGAAYTAILTATYNSDFSADIPLQSVNNRGSTDVIMKRTDATLASQFQGPTIVQPSTSINAATFSGWGPIMVSVIGGPVSAAVLDIEIITHFELVFDDSDAMALVMTPAPGDNTMLRQVSASISQAAGSVFTEIGKDASTAITALARRAMVNGAKRLVAAAPAMLMG